MKPINIFLQGHGVVDIAVIDAERGETITTALARIDRDTTGVGDLFIFIEDLPEPVEAETLLEELLPLAADEDSDCGPLRLHVNLCRKIAVSVRFNGETADRRFAPSATVERVRRWAARRAFGLSPRDAAEHVLQIQGGSTRPDRDVHIGTLTDGKVCAVALDLVPAKRVEG